MAVRFKFRSSSAVDSIDLGGRPSISVRDLRSKILDSSKLLRSSIGFHLLISDSSTNKTLDDEDFQIPAGSDVIIKRVPSSAAPSELDNTRGGGVLNVISPSSKNVNMDNFRDFGNEVYPTFDSLLGESDQDVGNLHSKNAARSRYHNNDESDLSEAISKEIVGENCKYASDTQEERKESKTNTRSQEYKKSIEGGACLPTELRCPLCHAIFKDAVMIPCCQHSFCNKCIRSTLTDVRKCPKCSSPKCSVNDLLPNLSLRQAIERFIEAQASIGAMDNDLLPKDAPDGESGINQAVEPTPTPSIHQQENQDFTNTNNLNSPSLKGSNRIQPESTPDNKSAAALKIRLDESKPGNDLVPSPLGVSGENKSGVRQGGGDIQGGGNKGGVRYQNENVEGNMPIQRRPDFVFNNNPDGGPGIMHQQQNKYTNRRNDRTCYFCGSPGHFIRDCPNRFSGDGGGFQGNNTNTTNNNASGYVPQADWSGVGPNAAFNAYRPAFNMYGNPAFNAFENSGGYPGAVNPYQMNSYGVPGFYSGMANPYGYMNMRMGGMANMGGMGNMGNMPAGVERPLGRPDQYMDPHSAWYQQNQTPNDQSDRDGEYEERSEEYQYNEMQRNPARRRPHESDTESPDEEYPRNRPQKKPAKQQHYSSEEEPPHFERKPEKERERERDREREREIERERGRRSHHSEKEKSVSDGSRYKKGKEVSERRNSSSERRISSGSRHHEDSSTMDSRERRNAGKGKEGIERRRESDRWEMVDGSDEDRRRRERHHGRRKRH